MELTAQAHRADVANVHGAPVAEARRAEIDVFFRGEHEQLPDAARRQVRGLRASAIAQWRTHHEDLQQAVELIETAIVPAGQVARLP